MRARDTVADARPAQACVDVPLRELKNLSGWRSANEWSLLFIYDLTIRPNAQRL